jgi:hypothetical protein
MNRRHQFENVGIDGRTLLEWILKKDRQRLWTELNWFRTAYSGLSCWTVHWTVVSWKGVAILSEYTTVSFDNASWSCLWNFRINSIHSRFKRSMCDYLISEVIILSTGKKRQNYPCNRPWRPIGLWDFEAPTFSRQSVHRWRWGQPYAPVTLYPKEESWYFC